jgi:hypothetical protein
MPTRREFFIASSAAAAGAAIVASPKLLQSVGGLAANRRFIETSKGRGRSFLDNSSFTLAQKTAIASGNWQRLIAPVTKAFG